MLGYAALTATGMKYIRRLPLLRNSTSTGFAKTGKTTDHANVTDKKQENVLSETHRDVWLGL